MSDRKEIDLSESSSGELLAKNGFTLFKGWDEELAQQLVDGSRQRRTGNYYVDDAKRRFPTVEGAERWYQAKPRVVYSLAIESQIAGAIWFSSARKKGIEAGYTSSIRIHDKGRFLSGRPSSLPGIAFAETVHEHFDKTHQSKGVWIDANTSDFDLVKLLNRLHYVRHFEMDPRQYRAIMVRSRGGKIK